MNIDRLVFTVADANMLQASLTGVCLAVFVLKRLGVPSSCAFN